MAKRLLSLLLAVLTLLSVCVPAFAAEGTDGESPAPSVQPAAAESEKTDGDTSEEKDAPVSSAPQENIPEEKDVPADDVPEEKDTSSDGAAGDEEPTDNGDAQPGGTDGQQADGTVPSANDVNVDRDSVPDETMIAPASTVPGLQIVKGNKYYFDENGQPRLGWQKVRVNGQDRMLYFKQGDKSGRLLTGLTDVYGKVYLMKEGPLENDDTGEKLTGLQTYKNKIYYFKEGDPEDEETGVMQVGWQNVNGKMLYFRRGSADTGTQIFGKWNIYGKTYYLDPTTGEKRTGLITIGTKTYYFKEGDPTDEETGVMQVGWQNVNGKMLYFRKGSADTGTQIFGKWDIYGKTYYLDPTTGEKRTGLITIGTKTYYFKEGDPTDEETGVMQVGWQKVRVNGQDRMLYFRKGSADIGTQIFGKWDIYGKTYYLDPTTGEKRTGLITIGTKNYYFKEGDPADEATGVMQVGWQNVDGKMLYFRRGSADIGTQIFGKWDIYGLVYYLDPVTGEKRTGLIEDGGKNYYFKEGDIYQESTGVMQVGWQNVDGKMLYFRQGSADKGTQIFGKWDIYGKWYFLDRQTGEKKVGLFIDGGKKYYGKQGDPADPASGVMQFGWQNVNGHMLYFRRGNNEGDMLIGLQDIYGKKYLLKEGPLEDPTTGEKQIGWITLSDGEHYFKEGDATKEATGVMAIGWSTINGKKYYFNGNGVKLTGWQTISGSKYYLGTDGVMVTGWQTIDGNRYHFKSSGAMDFGLTYMDEQMYYFSGDGVLQTNTTIDRCRKTYQVNGDGVIVGYVTSAGKKAVKVLNSIGWSLWAAYNWAADLPYSNRPYRNSTVEGYANYGFNNRTGNCFVMNACLYEMAKMMGYDVRLRNGGVGHANGSASPHGWCEIYVSGGWYVYDSNFHNETGRDGYKIWYGKSGTWQYVKYGYYPDS